DSHRTGLGVQITFVLTRFHAQTAPVRRVASGLYRRSGSPAPAYSPFFLSRKPAIMADLRAHFPPQDLDRVNAVSPAIPLPQLVARLPQAALSGPADRTVQGITHDSRAVQPGDLFLCLHGGTHDGHRFAPDALAQGAVALVVNAGGLEAAGVTVPPETTVVSVQDTRRALPLLACAFYGDPSHSLTMVGVTGTNGKTTTTRMIAAILRAAGKRVGTIGTLGAELDGQPIPSDHTTPEADQLQSLLATMRD